MEYRCVTKAVEKAVVAADLQIKQGPLGTSFVVGGNTGDRYGRRYLSPIIVN